MSRVKKFKMPPVESANNEPTFQVSFLSDAQQEAWSLILKNDVSFLLGPAGVGKSHLALAYAISEVLSKRKQRIILTRPIVESGESLGYLPGDFNEKVGPYMMPLIDILGRLVGYRGVQRKFVDECIEVAPLAYMRGRTFNDAVCLFDEAQNATMQQLKMFLSRFGENSKLIINGDPLQSDLPRNQTALPVVVDKLSRVNGIGIMKFDNRSIVRHPLIGKILDSLND